jgi:hypothetical protein
MGMMVDYSIHFLDDLSRIVFEVDTQCDDDKMACEIAARLLPDEGQAEIWCGARRLGRLCRGGRRQRGLTRLVELENTLTLIRRNWSYAK